MRFHRHVIPVLILLCVIFGLTCDMGRMQDYDDDDGQSEYVVGGVYGSDLSAMLQIRYEGDDLVAVNPDLDFGVWFEESGMILFGDSKGNEWKWFRLTSAFGRENDVKSVASQKPELVGLDESATDDSGEVEYDYGFFLEQYKSGPGGLTQSFFIETPPNGDGALVIEARIGGDLNANIFETGNLVAFLSRNEEIFQYAAPTFFDAQGQELAAKIQLEKYDDATQGVLRLIVDDRDATYPIAASSGSVRMTKSPKIPEMDKDDSDALRIQQVEQSGEGFSQIIPSELPPNDADAGANAYQDVVLNSTPLAYWPLDEASGTASDTSGNGHDASAEGTPTYQSTSLLPSGVGYAVSLSDANRFVSGAFEKFPAGSTGYTIEYWVKINSNPMPTQYATIVGDWESGSDYYLMNMMESFSSGTQAGVRPHFNGLTGYYTETDASALLTPGQTYHVVSAWDQTAGTSTVYINGTAFVQTDKPTGTPSNTDNVIYLGKADVENAWNITLDEVAIYNRPLTAQEVANHYDAAEFCSGLADGTACDDGLYCNGDDTCSDETCSQHAGDPCGDDGTYCNGDESCNEATDACDHSGDPCDDGSYCNGVENCVEGDDSCEASSGNPCSLDDGIFCNGDEICNEAADACAHSGDPCQDNLFCNGSDSCDEVNDECDHAGNPCSGDGVACTVDSCNEENDMFAAQTTYTAGAAPYSVAISDLDGDGNQDLATANFFNHNVSVLLGNGDGTFAAQVTYDAGNNPYSVAIGDLDGDGNQDMAVPNIGSHTVSVLLGNGDGTFAARTTYAASDGPHSVAIGDLDGDGDQDLATANTGSDNVSVLLGHGDGTFAAQATYAAGDYSYFVAIGDLDGDGDQDLATANYGSNTVSVLLGHGDGTFAAQTTYTAGDAPYSVAIGDLDGDGNQDLATANSGSDYVSVLLGHGDGTFAAQATYAVVNAPRSVAIGDLDGDGDQDLATANFGNNVSVLLGHGDGTFAAQTTYTAGSGSSSVAISDLDGDGSQDLAMANVTSDDVSVLLGGNKCVYTPDNSQCDDSHDCTQDTCNASSGCSNDASATSGSECRASAGDCDVAESCDGVNVDCPADTLRPDTYECRASAGDCDVAEDCTGSSATCPTDTFQPNTLECRTSAGDCDPAEDCTGSSADCPVDTFQANTYECRASAGDCDVAEDCTGSSAVCPADSFQADAFECRASAGDCDVAEDCSGSSADCPADTLRPDTYECRASAGDCDVAEDCTGSSATCPTDTFQPDTLECRTSAGDCDPAEDCTGSSADCPANAFQADTYECRASAGDCDVAEDCTGSSAVCPADSFQADTFECRAASDLCDFPETCTGSSAGCPADAGVLRPNGYECRASAGDCDVAEDCSGSSADCPADAFVVDGESCEDNLYCNGDDTCDDGACTVHSGDPCTEELTCNESADECYLAYANEVIESGPLAYWPLDEASGDVIDFSGNTHHASPEGTPTYQETSLLLNGDGYAVTLSDANRFVSGAFEKFPVGSTGYTVEYWVKINSNPMPTQYAAIVGDRESDSDYYLMNMMESFSSGTQAGVRPHFNSLTGYYTETDASALLTPGQTYHVVSAWDQTAGTSTVYINGTAFVQTDKPTGTPSNTDNVIYLGKADVENAWNITLDEVAIYNRPLTAQEVTDHYEVADYCYGLDDGTTCDDGLFCNEGETCLSGLCQGGSAKDCDDSLWCTGVDSCNESTDVCDHAGNSCDDGSYCNGVENCLEADDSCEASSGNPCPLDDGIFCNGDETSDCNEDNDECGHTGDPCDGLSDYWCVNIRCSEATDECLAGQHDLWAMGLNNDGQLGDGTTTDRHNPVRIETSGVIAVAAGGFHNLFIKSDSSPWAMGYNRYGQLGDGTTTDRHNPVQIEASGVIAVAAGGSHSLFIKSDGSLWAMGRNDDGELGDGTTTDRDSPVQIEASGVIAVAAGGDHSLFIKSDGSLWATGWNGDGQLGDGTTTDRDSPVQIEASGVIAVAAGSDHSLFIKSDSSLWAMGYNGYGQLGDGTTTDRHNPVQIEASGVIAVAAGSLHSLFIKSDGSLWAMGDNGYGQLGDGTITDRHNPVQIEASGVITVAAGRLYSLFIKSDGSLWAMGNNGYGQLGDGTITDRHSPVPIETDSVTSVAGGSFHSLYSKLELEYSGCWIGETCYADAATKDDNNCLVCNFESGPTAWSNNDGESCDDTNFCNGTDTCSSGDCTVHAGNPCCGDTPYCYCDSPGVNCQCHDAAAINLLEFSAIRTEKGVVLDWKTGSEFECGAFSILRCIVGEFESLKNPQCALENHVELDMIIPCENDPNGSDYTSIDNDTIAEAVYSYYLREYQTTGDIRKYGPLIVPVDIGEDRIGHDGFQKITFDSEEDDSTHSDDEKYSEDDDEDDFSAETGEDDEGGCGC